MGGGRQLNSHEYCHISGNGGNALTLEQWSRINGARIILIDSQGLFVTAVHCRQQT